MVVIGLGKNLLLKSVLGHCVWAFQDQSTVLKYQLELKIYKTVPHIHIFVLISGNEGAISENGSEVFTAFDKSIFEEAKKLGINRTVHAGEDGPSENVRIAVEEMFAQRIGHGYRVMQDKELYRKCRYEF